MANYSQDFEGYSTGTGVPSGWTQRWTTTGVTTSVLDVSSDRTLRRAQTTNARRGITYDTVDSDADRDDCEVLALVSVDTIPSPTVGSTNCGPALRGSGAAGSENVYTARLYTPNGTDKYLQVHKYVGGTGTTIVDYSFSWSTGTKYWIRLRANGTTVQARIWADGGSEPGTWQVDTTDSSVSGTGWAGIFTFQGAVAANHDTYAIAVATNGDTAALSSGSVESGAASGNEVTTSSIVGSSLFSGALSGNEVTTSSIVGASKHDAAASGNAVVSSSVIGASTFDGAATGNAIVTSSIVGDSVAAGSAVASGNAVVTSSIIGASVFNGIALGDIVVTGSFVGQGANTAGAASGNIVVSASFVSDAPVTEEAPAGGGKGSSRKKRVIYERIEAVEDFVEAMESEVLQEPKVKAKLRKVKKLKPETVENTEESANAWIEYYDDLLQALRDQERAEQIRRDLENSAYMLQTALRNREMQDLMRIEAIRQEEDIILLLMAA